MTPRRSILKSLRLPEAFGVVLLTLALILTLSPYLAGADLGIFKVPELSGSLQATMRWLGPALLAAVVFLFLPIIPTNEVSAQTGDDCIDNVCTALRKLPKDAPDTDRRDILAGLFDRAAFYPERQGNWSQFLFALSGTRTLLASQIRHFKTPELRSVLDDAAQHMSSIESRVAKSLYGLGFPLSEHIRNYKHSSSAFIDNLPDQVIAPDASYAQNIADEIGVLRGKLKDVGLAH